ncbi:MAG: hypothetical protein D6798_10800 [Deltaproteobacteria bacterium]|nr:MAG: hypothetical protein D6798_10800 [Deltaproteobacteria bacterium]
MPDIDIRTDWRGLAAPPAEHVAIALGRANSRVIVEVDAPFHGDPPPPAPPGPTWELWEHEVVELFIAGPGDHYLELELSPHGHHLFLRLRGVRTIVERDLPLRFAATIHGRRWSGRAELDAGLLPAGPHRINATAIHGRHPRRYLSWLPLPGSTPDFHQLDAFRPARLDTAPIAPGSPDRSAAP